MKALLPAIFAALTATMLADVTVAPDEKPLPITEVQKAIVSGKWKWGSGGTVIFKEDGTATHTRWKYRGEWRLKKDGTVWLNGDKTDFEIQFKTTGKAIVTAKKGGKKTTLSKVEVK